LVVFDILPRKNSSATILTHLLKWYKVQSFDLLKKSTFWLTASHFQKLHVKDSSWAIDVQLTLVISNSMGPWKIFESTVVWLKRSYEDTGSVVCLTTKGRQLEWNFEELKPASHVPILGTILNIFDVFVAVFFSLLNSLNLVKRLIASRYLFLCGWICLSVLFMFFTCCIVIKLHPSWRIFLCAILFIYNKLCVFIIQ
jgi:hypothetical protein